MSVPRDTILNALFQRLKTKLGSAVVTIGRRHMMPPTLTTAMQPALFVVQGPQEEHQPHPRGTGGKVILDVLLIAYTYDVGSNSSGATAINVLIGLIEDALSPDTASDLVQNLGGIVDRLWIEGLADIDPGVFGQQAVAILPVKILVP